MRKVYKIVVISEQNATDAIRILEENGYIVGHIEELTPTWEQVWDGFVEADRKYKAEMERALNDNLRGN